MRANERTDESRAGNWPGSCVNHRAPTDCRTPVQIHEYTHNRTFTSRPVGGIYNAFYSNSSIG